MSSLNDLSVALQKTDQRHVARARSYAQSFTSVWGSNVPASYIDLGNFVRLLKQQSNDAALGQLADRVTNSISQLVVAEKHGANKPGANGVSIYFPNSQLYKNDVAGAQSYTQIANRFASESLWDEYLLFGYTGQTFQATTKSAAVPQRGATIGTSVAGKLTLSPVKLSATSVAPGKSIRLSTTIQGPNVGYVYLFAGYLDTKANSVYVADMDFLESPDTRQVQGVYYPDWGDKDSFTMQFDWEPIVYALTDGKTTAVTALKPESYGASGEEAVYTVDGTYTIAESGESLYARLYLSNGELKHVYGFRNKNQSSTGAPSEITPEVGDTFTILEQWLDQGASGAPATSVTQKGKTLTFGNQWITWKELDAAAGEYVVGFVVRDLDGNAYQTYGKVTVK
jgi:hypothetical protein